MIVYVGKTVLNVFADTEPVWINPELVVAMTIDSRSLEIQMTNGTRIFLSGDDARRFYEAMACRMNVIDRERSDKAFEEAMA